MKEKASGDGGEVISKLKGTPAQVRVVGRNETLAGIKSWGKKK